MPDLTDARISTADERLTRALAEIGSPDRDTGLRLMIGPDRSGRIAAHIAAARDALTEPADDLADDLAYEPEHARPEPADPDVPDPTIEVLPLPDREFVLVLSGWPDGGPDVSALQQDTGATHVLVVPHPVYVPDATRTGVNAAVLAAQTARRPW